MFSQLLYSKPLFFGYNRLLHIKNNLIFFSRIMNHLMNLIADSRAFEVYGTVGVLSIFKNTYNISAPICKNHKGLSVRVFSRYFHNMPTESVYFLLPTAFQFETDHDLQGIGSRFYKPHQLLIHQSATVLYCVGPSYIQKVQILTHAFRVPLLTAIPHGFSLSSEQYTIRRKYCKTGAFPYRHWLCCLHFSEWKWMWFLTRDKQFA